MELTKTVPHRSPKMHIHQSTFGTVTVPPVGIASSQADLLAMEMGYGGHWSPKPWPEMEHLGEPRRATPFFRETRATALCVCAFEIITNLSIIVYICMHVKISIIYIYIYVPLRCVCQPA